MTVTSTYGVYLAEQDSFRYQMFEINMDEYLDDEIESVKLAFEAMEQRNRRWRARKARDVDGTLRLARINGPVELAVPREMDSKPSLDTRLATEPSDKSKATVISDALLGNELRFSIETFGKHKRFHTIMFNQVIVSIFMPYAKKTRFLTVKNSARLINGSRSKNANIFSIFCGQRNLPSSPSVMFISTLRSITTKKPRIL